MFVLLLNGASEIKGLPMAERIRACQPFRYAHCAETGVMSSIPLAAVCPALGASVQLKFCLSGVV